MHAITKKFFWFSILKLMNIHIFFIKLIHLHF